MLLRMSPGTGQMGTAVPLCFTTSPQLRRLWSAELSAIAACCGAGAVGDPGRSHAGGPLAAEDPLGETPSTTRPAPAAGAAAGASADQQLLAERSQLLQSEASAADTAGAPITPPTLGSPTAAAGPRTWLSFFFGEPLPQKGSAIGNGGGVPERANGHWPQEAPGREDPGEVAPAESAADVAADSAPTEPHAVRPPQAHACVRPQVGSTYATVALWCMDNLRMSQQQSFTSPQTSAG